MRPPADRSLAATLTPPGLLVLGMAVATHSVVRYQLWIVVVYTVLAGLLVFWVLRSGSSAPVAGAAVVGGGLAAVFALVAVLHLTVRPYTYLTRGDGWLVRSV